MCLRLLAWAACGVAITTEPIPGTAQRISTTYTALPADVRPDDRLLLADGCICPRVLEANATEVRCQVERGGLLAERQGISLPGGNIRAPERTSYTVPDYPVVARAAKVEGVVILEATIDEAGVVRSVKVLRSIPLLDQAAIDAVSKWRYTPTRLNGQPIAVLMTVTVRFALK